MYRELNFVHGKVSRENLIVNNSVNFREIPIKNFNPKERVIYYYFLDNF